MYVIALSHDKKISDPASVSHARHIQYASLVEGMAVIVANRGRADLLIANKLTVILSGGQNSIFRAINIWQAARNQAKLWRLQQVVVTSQSPFGLGLIAWLVAKEFSLSLQVQLHGDFFGVQHKSRATLSSCIKVMLARFVLKQALTIRVASKRIQSSLLQSGFNNSDIRVLPVQISVEKFINTKALPLWNYEDTNNLVVLFVGRFVKEKNLPMLLRAFVKVLEFVPKARLCLVGEGPEEADLRELAKDLFGDNQKAILWYKWQNDISHVIAAATIYALPSNEEGYALVIPEAMSAGVPVVTTNVGCVGELFIHQIHGLVVQIGDEIGFANALIKLLKNEDLRKQYGLNGQMTMRQQQLSEQDYAQLWVDTLK